MNDDCWSDHWWSKCRSCTQSEEEIFECISYGVDRIWHSKWWAEKIVDNNSQLQLIQAMQQRYLYPHYLDLVGYPSDEDYISKGELTTSRKAELLLIGTFSWKGLTIAKHQSALGYKYHYTGSKPRWGMDDKGWYLSPNYSPVPLNYNSFFYPFQDFIVTKLTNYLYEQEHNLGDREGIIPVDGNIFNCREENLRAINLRGRPMRCKECNMRVTKENSRVIRINDSRLRFCKFCIETMSNRSDLKQGWW
ncbi:MAG: hypothetical protein AB2765_11210 [Candidatus Thiodiazotropha endolucinida]